ncbi:MAG: autotransporter-associated beta strand repeat-containing protein [Opitutae bacterium]|nr:autotransporter-associated beta strand repeat-containing protein [Opitutae bacterium]MCD8298157.1 autotransporter-associated beta strand repeat-containing protein [Opitutae bacterium]
MVNSKLILTTLVAAAAAITTIPALADDLTWAGDNDGNIWSSESTVWGDSETTFQSGDNATFDATGASNSIVTLGEDITAGTITVSETGYTFAATDSAKLTADTFNISGSGNNSPTSTTFEITIDSSASVSVGTLAHVSAGSTLTVNGTFSAGEVSYGGGFSKVIGGIGTFSATTFTDSTNQTAGYLYITVANFNVDTFVDEGKGAVTFSSSDSVNIGTLELGGPDDSTTSGESIVFSGTGNYTIGAITAASVTSNTSRGITVESGTTLNVGAIDVPAKITTLAIGGTVNVNSEYYSNTSEGTAGVINYGGTSYSFSITDNGDEKGTLNATKLVTASSGSGALTISVSSLNLDVLENDGAHAITLSSETANIGSIVQAGSATITVSAGRLNVDSITKTGSGGAINIDTTTIGLNSVDSADFTAALWITSGSTVTFDLSSGQSLTLSGAVTANQSGESAIVKIGAGTLTLSGTNTYTAGTTIAEGIVVAASSGALGNGAVTIDGGQLTVSGEGVTVSNEITVVLDNYVTSSSTDAEAAAYAIVIDGATLSSEIAVTASDEFLSSLVAGEEYAFNIVSGNYDGDISYDALEALGYSVSLENGIITISVPEPSMFGLLAGLGALGFVAARRRRNRKA